MVATTVLHHPTLKTVLMIENQIRKAGSYPTKKELWESLPKGVQYQTLNLVLDYLESSRKILMNKGEIVWTFPSSKKLQNLIARSVRLR
ncbi:MAG TPA: hypothetical protein VFE98_08860 [Candidatus Bathyarchaeia archaeon]|nr:hypothetical protein [Candidatus Bathyarchaeia archaeon]